VITPNKILIFRQSSLGDIILTFPIIAELKNTFPDCTIDFLTKSQYSEIIDCRTDINTTFSFDSNPAFYSIARQLQAIQYDYFIDLQSNLRSAYLQIILRSAKCLRYPKRRIAREMVVRCAGAKKSVEHTVMAYLKALSGLGIKTAPNPPHLEIPEKSATKASKYITSNLPESATHLIALCPGAKHFEKKWPYSNFKKVAEDLLEIPSIGILVFSEEVDAVPPDLEISHNRVLPLRNLSIMNVAALIKYCQLAVTNDSGLMHLANSVGVPTISIFGPTNPRLGFAPTLPDSVIVCDDVRCSPCSVHGQKPCRQKEKYCFTGITPDRILDIITAKLD